MKVLSLTEPCATLIKEGKKKVETRSWKTSYRGELYIHASSTSIPKDWKENKEFMDLVKDKTLNFGNIICKCNLVDCIYMSKEYVDDMKKNNYQEYLCGDYKEGRYAWILENVKPLNIPIKAKGHLSIWNYEDRYLHYYLEQLGYLELPEFLKKYLKTPALLRLKKVGYFCGMDYASKEIYNFREYISRYDHSLTVALIVYKLTKDKKQTLAGLFHDIATPCFSHVIDYMNKDYEKQESTERYTEKILLNDEYLKQCLKEDNIHINDIINFKKFTVVDNERPKACADRIDGVILTGIGWTKNIEKSDIKNIVEDMCIFKNEYNETEIGFKTLSIAKKVVNVSKSIDIYCHSNEDNYMMELLAKITKLSIERNYISYENLYSYNEDEIFNLFEKQEDDELKDYIYEFKNIKKQDIPKIELENVKIRDLKPLVNNKRIC